MKIQTQGIHNIQSVKLQPGKYMIIDPCYLIKNNEDWHEICNSFEHNSNKFDNLNTIFTLKNGKTLNGLIFGTAHGDGVYPIYNNGTLIGHAGVDAGLLSLIPKDVVEELINTENETDEHLGIWVNIESITNPYFINDCQGDVAVGNIEIHTGDALNE